MQNKTGFYTITLYCGWFGYTNPNSLGTIVMSGLKGADDYIIQKDELPRIVSEIVPEEAIHNNPKDDVRLHTFERYGKKNLTKFQLISVFAFIISLLTFFSLLNKRD